ncbi:MAG: uncharacterized protein QOC99_1943 [Acidobacteriota bacterium]|jgi:uncharacterized protein YggE|nr:uncharacterized protein [Acidobacteriota bacterium]
MRKSLLTVRVVALALWLAFASLGASAAQTSNELTVVGRLTPTVEAGGWLVVADYGKYLILNSRQFQREPWFREGALVEAFGQVREGVVTTYMQGVPFQARTMRARGGNSSGKQGSGATQGASTQTGGAQSTRVQIEGRALTRVVVSGDATVQAQPDTAILTIAVVTQNSSASEAQAENASKTDAVVRAIKAAAGASAEVKTSGYSLQPQYAYKEGTPPTITSYLARNAVTVTLGELNRVGSCIDAASRAGANSVDGLAFTLRRDEQPRRQALADATREAVSKARVIADALGGHVVRIVEVQEAGAVRPTPIYEAGAAGRVSMTAQTAPTPVESGSLEIRAQVQLVAEIETKE